MAKKRQRAGAETSVGGKRGCDSQATTAVSGLCFGGAQSRNIFRRLRGERSSLGLVKSWQTGGSVGS